MSITKLLAKAISNYSSQTSIGSRFRARRIAPLMDLIEELACDNDIIKIIDIGGTAEYWDIVPTEFRDELNVRITIINLPGNPLPKDHGCFTFVHADGCNLSKFENNSFHIAHSNSVIEHVGDWNRMIKFSCELKRVAQKYFVQTPNFWFPVEPHAMTPFFHWLPKSIRVWWVKKSALGHWSKATSTEEAVQIVQSARLLNKKKFHLLFDDAVITTERLFLLPKSFVAIRD